MIEYKKGDLLLSGCDMICHQVNAYGVMGAGIALQIRNVFPQLYNQYRELCKTRKNNDLYGNVWFYFYDDKKAVANCFSQIDGVTDIEKLKSCVRILHIVAANNNFKTVGIPYKYGCGIAKGDWLKVKQVFENEFSLSNIKLQIWELEPEKNNSPKGEYE